jgi:hypothetical protein
MLAQSRRSASANPTDRSPKDMTRMIFPMLASRWFQGVAVLQTKTHFEQVPIEIVKKIVEEQIHREEVVKPDRDSAEKSFELEVWEAPLQPVAQFHTISQRDRKLS